MMETPRAVLFRPTPALGRNDSLESDSAINAGTQRVCARAGSLPIESYRSLKRNRSKRYNQPCFRPPRMFREFQMRRNALLRLVMIALFTSVGLAFQAGNGGPYKVLKTARV